MSNTLAGNGWRETMICSIKAQALASGQVSKVVVVSKNGGPTEQIQDLQNLVSQGVNILIVNPSDPEKLNSIIAEATKQGAATNVLPGQRNTRQNSEQDDHHGGVEDERHGHPRDRHHPLPQPQQVAHPRRSRSDHG